jgi:hypothetical protein
LRPCGLGHHLPIDNCLLVLSLIARFRTRVSHKYIPCPLWAALGLMIRHCPARPKGPPVKRRRYASLISERVGLPTLHMCSPIIHCPLWQLQWRHSPTPSPGWPPSKSYALKLVAEKWAAECFATRQGVARSSPRIAEESPRYSIYWASSAA